MPDSAALSTGILCDGLIAIDIDIDDPALVVLVVSAAGHFLGAAPERKRSDSSRCLRLYRASEGEPSKRSIAGTHGKVEALGYGQQFVAYGSHPSGATYEWSPCGLLMKSAEKRLTPVTQGALTAFFQAIAPYIGAAGCQPHPYPCPFRLSLRRLSVIRSMQARR